MTNRVGALGERSSEKSGPRNLHRDPAFWIAFLAGPAFWFALSFILPVTLAPKIRLDNWRHFLFFAAIYPILEEWLFRGLLQPLLLRQRVGRAVFLGFSGANLIATFLFVIAHFFRHPPMWAALVVFPSLIFGWFRDRYQRVYPAILLHCFYNLGYFVFFRSG